MDRFEGKCVIITGASGNLGQAVAERMAGEGASLVLLGRNKVVLETLSESLPGRHLTIALDLLDKGSVASAVEDAAAKFGSIDIALAMAGGFAMGPAVHETGTDAWEKMQEMNVGTLLPLLAAIAPKMIEEGSGKIVTVGAFAAQKGNAGMAAYAAAKSAVMRVTESAAAELKAHGINVNGVLPAVLDTPENREAMPNANPENWVSLAQLAGVIAFLASAESNDMNGALVPVVGKG